MSYEYRVLSPDEHYHCYVGSGECLINATHATDDGSGNEVYMCLFHRHEMERWQRTFEKLSPHLFEQLEAHVETALKKQNETTP